MPSLREIKDHIASVRGTLKITSAMKLVASSKLRKAQKAIETLRPYEETLGEILSTFPVSAAIEHAEAAVERTAIVAISSNTSLCGAFNANVIKKTYEEIRKAEGEVVVYSVGRKIADNMRKAGYPSPGDYMALSGSSNYELCSALSRELCEAYAEGKFTKVVLVYNHFVSTSKQDIVSECYLPFSIGNNVSDIPESEKYLVEPSGEEVVKSLLPQVVNLKLFAAVLDSAAAEHAARTIAMQAATDNGEALLAELTLDYNKGRQQKITSEILDLIGGSIA